MCVLQMSSKLNPKAVIFQKIAIQILIHVSGGFCQLLQLKEIQLADLIFYRDCFVLLTNTPLVFAVSFKGLSYKFSSHFSFYLQNTPNLTYFRPPTSTQGLKTLTPIV